MAVAVIVRALGHVIQKLSGVFLVNLTYEVQILNYASLSAFSNLQNLMHFYHR